jgi:hypothetical protein
MVGAFTLNLHLGHLLDPTAVPLSLSTDLMPAAEGTSKFLVAFLRQLSVMIGELSVLLYLTAPSRLLILYNFRPS